MKPRALLSAESSTSPSCLKLLNHIVIRAAVVQQGYTVLLEEA